MHFRILARVLVSIRSFHQYFESLILSRQICTLALYFRSVQRDLFAYLNPEMDEDRKGKKACNENAAVHRSNSRVQKLNSIEPPKLCCNGQEYGNGRCAPKQLLGPLHGA